MTDRKWFSLFGVLAALVTGMLMPSASVASQGKPNADEGPQASRSWSDPPANAKDVRTAIYRASRAGKRQEGMVLGSAVISRAGIVLKGTSCKKGAYWLTFSETAQTRVVGGKRCRGDKSFERRPNYGPKRFESLLDHVSSRILAGIKVDILNVGWPRLVRSDGKRALILFDRDRGKVKHPIRAIRFDGSKRTIERY